MLDTAKRILAHPHLVCFWDFQESPGEARVARGPYRYRLVEMNGPIRREPGGIFGPYAARLERGQWFLLPRRECPALDFHGRSASLTLAAWIKRSAGESRECQAVAGMWNEEERKRQYALFLNLRIWNSAEQAAGHVSSCGGPTPGYPWCMTAAIGRTPVSREEWHMVAFTYDGEYAKVYLDGELDEREKYNPFRYDEGLFDGGEDGADFTVGAVYRAGEMGNFYTGLIGGLAVFNRALAEEEIRAFS